MENLSNPEYRAKSIPLAHLKRMLATATQRILEDQRSKLVASSMQEKESDTNEVILNLKDIDPHLDKKLNEIGREPRGYCIHHIKSNLDKINRYDTYLLCSEYIKLYIEQFIFAYKKKNGEESNLIKAEDWFNFCFRGQDRFFKHGLITRRTIPEEPPYFESVDLSEFLQLYNQGIKYNFSDKANVVEVDSEKFKLSHSQMVIARCLLNSLYQWISKEILSDALNVKHVDIGNYFKHGQGKMFWDKYIQKDNRGNYRLK